MGIITKSPAEFQHEYDDYLSKFPITYIQNMTIDQYTDEFIPALLTDAVCNPGNIHPQDRGIYKFTNIPKISYVKIDGVYAYNTNFGNTLNEVFEELKKRILLIIDNAKQNKYSESKKDNVSPNLSKKIAIIYSNYQFIPICNKIALLEIANKLGSSFILDTKYEDLQTFVKNKQENKDFWEYYIEVWNWWGNHHRYWVMNHTWRGASSQNVMDLINQAKRNNYAMMQYEYNIQSNTSVVSQSYDNALQISEGDYLFLKGENNIYAYGRIIKPRKDCNEELCLKEIIKNRKAPYTSRVSKDVFHFEDAEAFYFDFTEGKEKWGQRIDVEEWLSNGKVYSGSVNYIDDKINYVPLRQIDYLSAKNIFNEIGVNNMTSSKTDNMVKILKAKKNIILQGAPGTGKTYNTASLALSVIGEDVSDLSHAAIMQRYEELLKEGQIQFTTFHQSMDYEDFVEGIKPRVIEDEGTGSKIVTYDVENGIFKRICNRAKGIDEDGNTNNNFELSWQKLVEKLGKDNYIDVPYLSDESKTFRVEMNEYGTGLANRTYKNDIYEKGEWISGKSKFFSKDQLFNIHQEKKGTPAGGHDNYRRAIIAYMRDEKNGIGLEQKYNPPMVTSNGKPYVLIIDEINRGNVSKIFGELITLLESDKRELVGEDAKNQDLVNGQHTITVTLPYSKEPFTVPSNLYIIGTMNTTDRSVGNIDYAVRRRFSFVTLESNRSVVLSKNNNDETATSVQLFDAVMMFLKVNKTTDMDIDDLMVGHSYFLADSDEELNIKWKYDILPLLREYYKDGIIKKDIKKDTSIPDFIDSKNE